MVCKKCGKDLPRGSTVCSRCGSPVGGGSRGSGTGKQILTILLSGLGTALISVLVFSLFFSGVVKTEEAIDAIGVVTMDSLAQIQEAEERYEDLSESARKRVENRGTLVDARETYDAMADAIERASEAIDAAAEKIYYYDDRPYVAVEDAQAVQDARAAYDGLKEEGLEAYLPKEKLEKLEEAETGYANAHGGDLFLAATESEEQGKYQEAIDAYQELLELYPDHYVADSARFGMANCLSALGKAEFDKRNYEAALDLYQQALEVDEDHYEAKCGAMNCTLKVMDEEFKAGNYETVVKELEKAYETYGSTPEYVTYKEKVDKKLESIRPQNGKTLENKLNWGRGKFKVEAGNEDAVVKLESVSDSSKYVMIYVRANSTAEVSVADGTYNIKYATGDTWYGEEAMFGENTAFSKANQTITFETTYSGSYVYYSEITITLYKVAGGDLGTSTIPAGSF